MEYAKSVLLPHPHGKGEPTNLPDRTQHKHLFPYDVDILKDGKWYYLGSTDNTNPFLREGIVARLVEAKTGAVIKYIGDIKMENKTDR